MISYVTIVELTIFVILTLALLPADSNESELPSYVQKLQQLRQTALSVFTNKTLQNGAAAKVAFAENSKNKKPKRYKCVLIEDDEDIVENPEHRFKIVPNEKKWEKILGLPTFASAVQTAKVQNENNEAEIYYFTTTTTAPLMTEPMPVRTKEKHFFAQNVNNEYRVSQPPLQKAPLKQIRLPIVKAIPLKKTHETSLNHNNFQHTQTSLKPSAVDLSLPIDNNQQKPEQKSNQSLSNQSFSQLPRKTVQTIKPPQEPTKNLALAQVHCNMITHYAKLYNVKDIKGWVHHNCAFAKLYLPNATCVEIDVLVASCFR